MSTPSDASLVGDGSPLVGDVTGAGSGLGAAMARALDADGATVVLVDIDGEAADAVGSELVSSSLTMTVDVTDEAALTKMATSVCRRFGRIDALVANAGVEAVGRAHDVQRQTWDRALAVMLTGTWLSIRSVLPVMLDKRAGAILTVSSVAGLVGTSDAAAYAAAKAGIIGLTRQVASDYAEHGVRANTVCPGLVDTPLARRHYQHRVDLGLSAKDDGAQAVQAIGAEYPLGLGTVEDVAHLAAFLVSSRARWITGQTFVVDGGVTMR